MILPIPMVLPTSPNPNEKNTFISKTESTQLRHHIKGLQAQRSGEQEAALASRICLDKTKKNRKLERNFVRNSLQFLRGLVQLTNQRCDLNLLHSGVDMDNSIITSTENRSGFQKVQHHQRRFKFLHSRQFGIFVADDITTNQSQRKQYTPGKCYFRRCHEAWRWRSHQVEQKELLSHCW